MSIVQKHYTPQHFRGILGSEHVSQSFEDSVLAPMFDVIWQMASEALSEEEYSLFGITDATFLEKEGHFKRGKWLCVVDGRLISVMPVFTDLNVISGPAIYRAWRVLVEGGEQQANAFLVRFSSFVRQYVSTATVPVVQKEAAAQLRQHRVDMLSRQVRDFYRLTAM